MPQSKEDIILLVMAFPIGIMLGLIIGVVIDTL